MPDKMDQLTHRAIFTVAKAKREDKSPCRDSRTSSCGLPFSSTVTVALEGLILSGRVLNP